jgi:hypothetical protein
VSAPDGLAMALALSSLEGMFGIVLMMFSPGLKNRPAPLQLEVIANDGAKENAQPWGRKGAFKSI